MMKPVYTIEHMSFELALVDVWIVVRLAKIRDAGFGETESILGDIKGAADLMTEKVPDPLVSFAWVSSDES